MDPNEKRDENVFSFMMQLVQEKHGDDSAVEFLNTEAERLYIEFGEKLVNYFEPMLGADKKNEFDKLIEQGSSQDIIMEFLVNNIENLEQKIMDVLANFRQSYLQSDDDKEL